MILEKIRRSLVVKTTLVFLVAAWVPFVLASLFFLQSSRKVLYNEIVKGLRSETELMRDALDARIVLLRSNAQAWADLDVMTDILIDDVDKRISSAVEGLKRDYALAGNIYAVKRDGEIVASSLFPSVGKRIAPAWLGKVLSGNIADVDTHPSEITGAPVISFAVPVKPSAVHMEVIGVLLLEYEVENLKDIAGQGGTLLFAIFDNRGGMVTASHEAPALRDLGATFSATKTGSLFSRAGYIGAMTHTRGYYDFGGFNWSLVYAVKEDTALDPIRRMERASLAAGTLGLALTLALVILFARRTSKPLKDLSETADRIAHTKDFSSAVYTAQKDEVGRLAQAFNRMVGEVKQYVQRIREMEEIVRRADRVSALGELSAGMAHEIKNPLGIIKSSAEILTQKLEKTELVGRLASAVSEEAARLEKLLEAFLQFARPAPPRIGPCRLNEVIEKALLLLQPHFANENIAVEMRLDDDLPSMITDGNQLQQVLINILINAMQAMPQGGKLGVTTRKTAEYPPLEPSHRRDVVEITVSDTGAGIAPELKESIFNPFFTTKEKGTGLGLTIAHRIVDGLGGWVRAEEGVPSGTVFVICLPWQTEERVRKT